MKTFILLLVVSLPAFSAECKLSGVMASSQKLETTLGAQTIQECRMLGSNTLEGNFFGLVSDDDKLTETKIHFRDENGLQTETIADEYSEF